MVCCACKEVLMLFSYGPMSSTPPYIPSPPPLWGGGVW